MKFTRWDNATPTERFWAKVRKSDVCWEWVAALAGPGYRTGGGYGKFGVDGKLVSAHRFAWELTHGPVPDGLQVLHRCDNRRCVRPDHLFLGTSQDNMDDKVAKGRQPRGSECGAVKLMEKDIPRIFEMHRRGLTLGQIALKFLVDKVTIFNVIHRKTWAHVSLCA